MTPVLDVPAEDVADLRRRLRSTRWAAPWPEGGWRAGTDQDELRRLVEHWADGYDWYEQQRTINSLPSATSDVDGVPLHWFRFGGEGDHPLPLVLTNGWPSTSLELVTLARRLATPTGHGGRAEDSFTVVVPSLPGFPLSPQRASHDEQTHELWHRLMTEVLGFERYAVHGGDLGAGISSRLAQAHPEAVVGLHLLAVAAPADLDEGTLSTEEREHLVELRRWNAEEGGYEHLQRTRPLSLAPALSDSPVGLLAWVLEKYRAWSDCGGDVGRRFSDDFLLTQASLYWFTNSIGTSFRPYWEHAVGSTAAVRRVDVPTAVAVFPHDLTHPPRAWAERTYAVTRYTRMPRGGHFAPHEEPGLLGDDIVEFLRPLR